MITTQAESMEVRFTHDSHLYHAAVDLAPEAPLADQVTELAQGIMPTEDPLATFIQILEV